MFDRIDNTINYIYTIFGNGLIKSLTQLEVKTCQNNTDELI